MTNTIILKNSSTQSAVPTTGDLSLGELAINTYDGKVFFKTDQSDSNGEQIVEIGELAVSSITDDPDTFISNLGITSTITELNYTDGVTSAIQTQLDSKASSSHNHTASDVTDFDSAALTVVQNNLIGGTNISLDIDSNGAVTITGPSTASQITSGTFADARISESSVTQHEAALTITESQISDLQSYLLAGDNISTLTNDAGYITATLTEEQVQDYVGAMFTGNTETLITVTYEDTDGTIDLVVNDDLSLYDNTTSGFITDYTVTEADVTQHEAAITITESQISDLGSYIENISTFDTDDLSEGATNLYYTDARVAAALTAGDNITIDYPDSNGTITISSSGGTNTIRSGSAAPSDGLGTDGDFYIDTASTTIYGPKSGGTWGSGTSLVGADGSDATANLGTTVSETGTSWTLSDATHANKMVHATNSSPISVTVPLNSSDDIAVGDQFLIKQHGTGQVTLVPETGSVTINSAETLSSRKQHSVMTLF